MRKRVTIGALVLCGLFICFAARPDDVQAQRKRFVLLAKDKLPGDLVAKVSRSGGRIEKVIAEIGAALVSSDRADFARKALSIPGTMTIIPDISVRWLDPPSIPEQRLEAVASPPFGVEDDFFYNLQWPLDVLDAPQAWEMGYRGQGARVVILDTGIQSDHPDLEPNLNKELSLSLVDGEEYDQPAGDHGTHVAGIIAAADNAFGTIGIAPEAEIISVKVIPAGQGMSSFFSVLLGIAYSAVIDADVVNMSFGSYWTKDGWALNDVTDPEDDEYVGPETVAAVVDLYRRAAAFAYSRGTLLFNSAGNEAIDYDQNPNLIKIPGTIGRIQMVSATGPQGWALDPKTNLNLSAFYTNYGKSQIDFAAPGGNVDPDLAASEEECVVDVWAAPCWAFDLVFSTGAAGDWFWSAGTSMASPYAAGVAALVVGANGGSMKPEDLILALRKGVRDLGPRGLDARYGYGLVNAKNTLVRNGFAAKEAFAGDRIPTSQLAELPATYSLSQNYPNPFNPSTEITFSTPETGEVRLTVFDVLGRPVARLVEGTLEAGEHHIQWNASTLPSGTYLYRLQAGTFEATRHMVLMK